MMQLDEHVTRRHLAALRRKFDCDNNVAPVINSVLPVSMIDKRFSSEYTRTFTPDYFCLATYTLRFLRKV